MALYILLYLIHLHSVFGGVYHHSATAVFDHGTPEFLGKVREGLKSPISQPFYNFPVVSSAQTSAYKVLEQDPYAETVVSSKHSGGGTKAGGGKRAGGKKHAEKGEKSSGHHSDHHTENAKKGHSGKENAKKEYHDEKGKKHHYNDGDEYKKEHHAKKGGEGGSKFKKGEKKHKSHVHKGFHDKYLKDEVKKADSFWSNHHEEGKWIHYGTRKKQHEKDGGSKKGASHHKEGKQSDSYSKKEECTKCV